MIVDLYSKRKKRAERNNQPEVYQYDNFPVTFRNQVIHIWMDAFPPQFMGCYWERIYDSLARELGWYYFDDSYDSYDSYSFLEKDKFKRCREVFLNEETLIDHLLDIIELTFRYITQIRTYISDVEESFRITELYDDWIIKQRPDSAKNELNHRFREHGLGYQFEHGKIIRIDSQFIHSEVVLKTLSLLSHPSFEGAEEEFYKAHEFYRKGEYKEAIINAGKAFESTMKTICEQCGWEYDKNSPAKKLINVILENKLIPLYLQDHFSSLRSILENGVPTVRNKTSGHGQGTTSIQIPDYLASYALHLTATNIVMLVEAYKNRN